MLNGPAYILGYDFRDAYVGKLRDICPQTTIVTLKLIIIAYVYLCEVEAHGYGGAPGCACGWRPDDHGCPGLSLPTLFL